MNIQYAQLSDPGRVRKMNEDRVGVAAEHGVFMVADGMGGAFGGEIASRITVDAVLETLAGMANDTGLDGVCAAVVKALQRASRQIFDYSAQQNVGNMGSTAVAFAYDGAGGRRAMVLHAGDSRAYRFRHGALVLLTRDHSVAEEVRLPEKALAAVFRNTITRAIGIHADVKVERTAVTVQPGDVILLCSDGLTHMLNDAAVAEIVGDRLSDGLDAVAKALVDAANAAGGKDNISVVLLQCFAVGVGDEDDHATADTDNFPTAQTCEGMKMFWSDRLRARFCRRTGPFRLGYFYAAAAALVLFVVGATKWIGGARDKDACVFYNHIPVERTGDLIAAALESGKWGCLSRHVDVLGGSDAVFAIDVAYGLPSYLRWYATWSEARSDPQSAYRQLGDYLETHNVIMRGVLDGKEAQLQAAPAKGDADAVADYYCAELHRLHRELMQALDRAARDGEARIRDSRKLINEWRSEIGIGAPTTEWLHRFPLRKGAGT
jgi:PPM family protein phosphatase